MDSKYEIKGEYSNELARCTQIVIFGQQKTYYKLLKLRTNGLYYFETFSDV